MLVPRRAPVRPRVLAGNNGDAFPLEGEVQELLARGARGPVRLEGPAGSGKTTALEHLAAALPPGAPVVLLDGQTPPEALQITQHCLVLYAGPRKLPEPHVAQYRLAPWGEEELIEYLLAVHRPRCAAVMARLRATDHLLFRGIPELWRIVLDQLAADPSLPDARSALHRHLEAQLPDTDIVQRARSACLNALVAPGESRTGPLERLGKAGSVQGLVRVLRHGAAQLLLAAERVADDVHGAAACDFLANRLPHELVEEAAALLRGDGQALEHLRALLAGPEWSHPMAASLLHAVDPAWVPGPGPIPKLEGAYLERVAWAGADLRQARLSAADLRTADLCGANLDRANLHETNLRQARLACASLNQLEAAGAMLADASLVSARGWKVVLDGAGLAGATLQDASLVDASFYAADLRGAIFAGADLRRAIFTKAEIEGADFSGTNLAGASLRELRLRQACFREASFREADLRRCDMEGMDLPGADCRGANLRKALLTGALMPGADLTGANLREAGLGDINWECACLRDADLSGASFHMGTTRSGLLITPIASEGTRTGYYTDDSEEQHFKAPEEIRKANLCGTDLRGARIINVDFYLVDLRGATYDQDQAEYFRRCRAIL